MLNIVQVCLLNHALNIIIIDSLARNNYAIFVAVKFEKAKNK